jgi:hypothetical protein
MRNLALIIVFGILLLGCLASEEAKPLPEVEKPTPVKNVTAKELIKTSSQGAVTTIEISSVNKTKFPLQLYDKEFESVGITSDSFIQLNRSHIPFLNESETVWLTPMIKDGKGVLFNAVYSRKMGKCNASSVEVLGKQYNMSSLGNNTKFGSDDKWKVLLDYQGTCLKRAIVYLDGYFYGLKEGDQISLFRNDNTILLEFRDLGSGPKLELVATKPS